MAPTHKIGMIIHSLSGGGIQSVVKTISFALIDRGVEVHIFVHQECNAQWHKPNLYIHDLCALKDDKARASYIKNLEDKKPDQTFDAFFAHSYGSYKILDYLTHPNAYYCIHSDYSANVNKAAGFSRFLKARKYQKLFNGKKLIAVSNGVANGIRSIGVKSKSVQVIYNPIDKKNISSLANIELIPHARPYILYVGALIQRKRVDSLINAYLIFLQHNSDYDLLIIGNGSEQSNLEDLVRVSSADKNIHFLGYKENPYPYIKNASLLVLPSESEAFGLVLLEALLLNTPVIASNTIGANEILLPPLDKFLFNARSESEIVEKLNFALERGYPEITISDRFNFGSIISKYISAINA